MDADRRAAPLGDAEVAYGILIGEDPAADPIVERIPPVDPVTAMEVVLRRALEKSPCLVSFSGGRDSSGMLALATRVARRDGHALPIPATLLFPGSSEAHEDEWQSDVLRHLQLDDWVRISIEGDELDAVGPVATPLLRRHGLLWPFNTHFHAPIIERASGGAVVTGFGGDEVALSSSTARAEMALAGSVRRRPSDVLAVGLACAPQPVRALVHRRRARSMLEGLPWLTPAGREEIACRIGDESASVPLGWSRVLRRCISIRRYFRVCAHSFSLVGEQCGVEVVHPFVEHGVLDALAARGGFAGLGDRSAIVQQLFGDLLPERTVHRPTKASFTDPLWTETARHFAAAWSGGGVSRELVDIDALRRHWLGGRVDVRSTPLLQAAWLHDNRAAAAAIDVDVA